MISLDIPGFGNVEFPEDMSDAEIQKAIETEILPQVRASNKEADDYWSGRRQEEESRPSWLGNVARGAGERGLEITGGLLRTIGQVAEEGGDWLEQRVPLGTVGSPGTPMTPEQIAADTNGLTGLADQLAATKLGYEPRTTIEDVYSNPLNVLSFAAEQGLRSIPDMVGITLNPVGYAAARAGEIGQMRAENDGRESATVSDILQAAPAAAASALLERYSTRGLMGSLQGQGVRSMRQVPGEMGRAALREAGTEAAQETTDYLGETLGTAKGSNLAEAGERAFIGAIAGGPFGAGARGLTASVQVWASNRGVEPTQENLEAAAEQGDEDALAILRAAGMSEEQITGLSPGRAAAFVERINARREAEAGRDALDPIISDVPRPIEPVITPDMQPWQRRQAIQEAQEATEKRDREALAKRIENSSPRGAQRQATLEAARLEAEIERRRVEDEGLASGEIDPAAVSRRARPVVPEVIQLGDRRVDGRLTSGNAADPGLERATQLRGQSNLPANIAPPYRPHSDEAVAHQQAVMARQGRTVPVGTEPEQAISSEAPSPVIRDAEGFAAVGRTPRELEQLRIQAENQATELNQMYGPEGRLVQTAKDIIEQEKAGQAFDLVAGRMRPRAGPDVRDTRAGGRPEGGIESQKTIFMDEGRPVEILSSRTVPDSKGNMRTIHLVRRYDPRTGKPEVDPIIGEAFEYEIEANRLTTGEYAVDPRQAQEMEEAATPPTVGSYTDPETGKKVTPKAAGQRADEMQGLPRQTYRETPPDPTVPGAEGPTSEVPGQGPVPRSPRPEQGAGPATDMGSNKRGPNMRGDQTSAERAGRAEADRRQRMWEQAQRGQTQDEKTGEQTEWGKARSKYENQTKGYSSKFAGADADGWPQTDEDGFVLSDKGGPIRFAEKGALIKVLRELRKQFPDAGLDIAPHPGPMRQTGRGGAEAYWTIQAKQAKPAPRQAEPEPEAAAAAPEQPAGAPRGLPGPAPVQEQEPEKDTETVPTNADIMEAAAGDFEKLNAAVQALTGKAGINNLTDDEKRQVLKTLRPAPAPSTPREKTFQELATDERMTPEQLLAALDDDAADVLHVLAVNRLRRDIPNLQTIADRYRAELKTRGAEDERAFAPTVAEQGFKVGQRGTFASYGAQTPQTGEVTAVRPDGSVVVQFENAKMAYTPTARVRFEAEPGTETVPEKDTETVPPADTPVRAELPEAARAGYDRLHYDVQTALGMPEGKDRLEAVKRTRGRLSQYTNDVLAASFDPETPANIERARRLNAIADRYEAVGKTDDAKKYRDMATAPPKVDGMGERTVNYLDQWERMAGIEEKAARGDFTVTQPPKRGPAAPKLVDNIDNEIVNTEEGRSAENAAEGLKHVPAHIRKAATDKLNDLLRLRAERGYNGDDEPIGPMKPYAIDQIDQLSGALRGKYNRYVKFLGAFKLGRKQVKYKDGKKEPLYTAETVGRELRALQAEIAKPLPTDAELEQDVSKWSVFQLDNFIDTKGAASEDGAAALAELRRRPGWGNRRPNEVIKERKNLIKQLKAKKPPANYAELEAQAADLEEDLARDPDWESSRRIMNRQTGALENMTPRQIAAMFRESAAEERARGATLKTKKAQEGSAELARSYDWQAERLENQIARATGTDTDPDLEEDEDTETVPENDTETAPEFTRRDIRDGSGREPGRRPAERGQPFRQEAPLSGENLIAAAEKALRGRRTVPKPKAIAKHFGVSEREAADALASIAARGDGVIRQVKPSRKEIAAQLAGEAAKPPRYRLTPQSDQDMSLLELLMSKGGLARNGDLVAMDAHRKTHPRYGMLVRKAGGGGMSLDEARELAETEGYIGQGTDDYNTTTERDLLEAIDEELRGNRILPDRSSEEAYRDQMERAASRLDIVFDDDMTDGELEAEIDERLALMADGIETVQDIQAVSDLIDGMLSEMGIYPNSNRDAFDIPFGDEQGTDDERAGEGAGDVGQAPGGDGSNDADGPGREAENVQEAGRSATEGARNQQAPDRQGSARPPAVNRTGQFLLGDLLGNGTPPRKADEAVSEDDDQIDLEEAIAADRQRRADLMQPIDPAAVPDPVNGRTPPVDAGPRDRLLVISCGLSKSDAPGNVPAIERYAGPRYNELRKWIAANPGQEPHIVILSGKFGFIQGRQPIPNYDQEMTGDRANKLIVDGAAENGALDAAHRYRSGYRDVFIVGGGEYNRPINAAVTQLVQAGVIQEDAAINRSTGNPGVQKKQMMDWVGTGRDAEAAPEGGTDEQLERLQDQVQVFASGMSAPQELSAGLQAWSGMETRGIGVEIGRLSNPGIETLAKAVVDQNAAVFVDSGAYGLGAAEMRGAGGLNDLLGELGPVKPKPLDFDEVLEKYNRIIERIAELNGTNGDGVRDMDADSDLSPEDAYRLYEDDRMGRGVQEARQLPLMVMPDIVRDQAGSLDLARRYREHIAKHIDLNVSQPIVPIQKGELSLAEAYAELVDILGTDQFVVGIPAATKAISDAELRDFLAEVRPARIHILGGASPATLNPKLKIMAEVGLEPEHLSADANILRGALWGQQEAGVDRKTAVREALIGKAGKELDRQVNGTETVPKKDTETVPLPDFDAYMARGEALKQRVQAALDAEIARELTASLAKTMTRLENFIEAVRRRDTKAVDRLVFRDNPFPIMRFRPDQYAASGIADLMTDLDGFVQDGDNVLRGKGQLDSNPVEFMKELQAGIEAANAPKKGTQREVDGYIIVATGDPDKPWAGGSFIEKGPRAGWQPDTALGFGNTPEEAAEAVKVNRRRAAADQKKRTTEVENFADLAKRAGQGQPVTPDQARSVSRYGDGLVSTTHGKAFLRAMGLTAKQADEAINKAGSTTQAGGGAWLYDIQALAEVGQQALGFNRPSPKSRKRLSIFDRLRSVEKPIELTPAEQAKADREWRADLEKLAPQVDSVADIRRVLAENVKLGILDQGTADSISSILDRIPTQALKGVRLVVQSRIDQNESDILGNEPKASGEYVTYDAFPDLKVLIVNARRGSKSGVTAFLHENAHALFDMISADAKAEARRIYDGLKISRQALHTVDYSQDQRFEEWFAESMADHYIGQARISGPKGSLMNRLDDLLTRLYKRIVDVFSNEKAQVAAFFDGLEYGLGRSPGSVNRRARNSTEPFSILTKPISMLVGEPKAWRLGAQELARDVTETWANRGKRANRQSFLGGLARAYAFSADGEFRSAIGRFDSATMRLLADTFHPQAGSVQRLDPELAKKLGMKLASNATFDEAVTRKASVELQNLDRILRPFREDQAATDRIVSLVQEPGKRRGGPESDAASKIAVLLKGLHKYMTDAGVDVGTVKNGYFPREIDQNAVINDAAGFLDAATKAYKDSGLSAKDAKDAAQSWQTNILYGGDGSPARKGAGNQSSFVQSRVLTKHADQILAQYYQRDPDLILGSYINRAVKRAEIAKRFGDNWKNWGAIEDQIRKEDPAAAGMFDLLRSYAATAAGVQQHNVNGLIRSGSSLVRTFTTLSLLEKSTFASIAEVVTPVLRSGSVRDFLPALGQTLNELRRELSSLPPSLAAELAADVGAIAGSGVNSIMAARFAGGDPLSRAQARVLSAYFRRIGLEQWTNATRIASTERAAVFLRRLSRDVAGHGLNEKSSRVYLQELGIDETQIDDFIKFVNAFGDDLPTSAQLDAGGAMGEAYRTGVLRFVDQTIMRPSAVTRPRWASHPIGAIAFQLQAFTYSFSKNVLLRSARLAKRAVTEEDLTAIDRAMFLAPLMMLPALAMTQAIVGDFRDWLFMDPERKAAETRAARIEKAISRAGLTGALDPYLQMVTGARYSKDPISTLTGPALGIFGQGLSAAVQWAGNNSPNTNAAERKTVEALYDMLIEPGANILLGFAPGSALTTLLTMGVLPAIRDETVDMLAGERRGHKQQTVFGLSELVMGKQFKVKEGSWAAG